MAATAEKVVSPYDTDSGVLTYLVEHQKNIDRIRAELEAKRPKLMRCLNAAYAGQQEMEKPHYRWTVKAEWVGKDSDTDEVTVFNFELTVVAQNESDAWAKACDEAGTHPNPRDTKRTFTQGKKVSATQFMAGAKDETDTMPRKTIGPKKKKKKL